MKPKVWIFLLLILLVAAFFRLWRLSSLPPGLFPDVAMNGNDAITTLRTAKFLPFYTENFGREGLFIWLVAFSFSFFGISVWSMKLVAAIFGILTVLGIYLLGKELFSLSLGKNSQVAALFCSFFLAVSFWHTSLSRLGFRVILLPFFLVFSFYFLFRGLREKKIYFGGGNTPQLAAEMKAAERTCPKGYPAPWGGVVHNWILAGLFFGLGFYTYTSFRLAVFLLPFVFIPWFFIWKKQNLQKQFLFSVFYFLLVAFIIALPLGVYFLKNPRDFASRASEVFVFGQKNPLYALEKSLFLHLGMFNFYGDPNWRHNLAGSPMLPGLLGILFLLGVFFSFKEVLKKSNYQQQNYPLLSVFYFLLSGFFFMLLPGILTYEGIPHSLRTAGVIPIIYIFAGLGAWKAYNFFKKNAAPKKLLVSGSILFLLATAVFEFNKYFFVWAKRPELDEAFTQRYADIGNYLNSLSPETLSYVIVNTPDSPLGGISIPAQTPIFIESTKFGQPRAVYLRFEDLARIKKFPEKTIIIPLYEKEVLPELQKKYPQGKIKTEKSFQFYEIE